MQSTSMRMSLRSLRCSIKTLLLGEVWGGGGVRGAPQKNDANDGWRQQILKANNIGEGSWLGTVDNAKKAIKQFFLITVKSYHNSLGHLGGGGGEGAHPLHPSPKSALLNEQVRTVATVHRDKQECLVKLFFSRRFFLQKYWNGYLYIRCQDWFILFTIYCSSCKYHAQVNDMQIHTKGLLFYWKLALIFKTTGIDVICGFYPKVRQK